jgi:hypothetical protein
MLGTCLKGALLACPVAVLVLFVGCGSASLGASGFGGGSSSGGSSGGNLDTGVPDEGIIGDATSDATSDGPADAVAPGTGALFVHASPDLPDLRFCWYVGAADAGDAFSATDQAFPSGAPAAFSNYPAVPVGGAAPLADASSMLGGDLYLVGLEANALASFEPAGSPQHSCYDLMSGAGGSFSGTAIHHFPVIPAGTVVQGLTSVIAVEGCLPALFDSNASTQRCGSSWSTLGGNLHVDVHAFSELTTVPAGQLAVQAQQLSPGLASLVGDGGAAMVSFGPQGGDGGVSVATLSAEGTVDPVTAAILDAATVPTDYGRLGFGVDVTGFDGGAGHIWMSLEQSLRLVQPMQDPAPYYAAQTTFIVAVVGDPNAPHAASDAAYDGTGLHILVLPLP